MILPLRGLGKDAEKSISFGATAAPRRFRAKPRSSRCNSGDAANPGLSATKALTTSPTIGSGLPITPDPQRPANPKGQLALDSGLDNERDTAVIVAFDDSGLDARQRFAHRSGSDIKRWRVGDHDAAGFGLPPVIVYRQAEGLNSPMDRLRIERLADAGNKAQLRKRVTTRGESAALQHHSNRRGCRVPDRHIFVGQHAVPALGVKIALVNDHRDAMRQRGKNAVGHAGGAAGEVQQRRIARIGRRDYVLV